MIKILLLSVGTNACYHVAKTLKEKFEKQFYIVGADINEQYLVPSCEYIDRFYKVPLTSDKDYYKTILEICEKENIDYLLPSFDADQVLFCDGSEDLQKYGVKSLGVSKETLELYKDKLSMNKFLKEHNFKIPKMLDTNKLERNWDYFVKPINGVGSQGAKKMSSFDICALKNPQDILIQEICHEPEITLECFYYKNTLRTVARERIASKSGVCTKTFISEIPELHCIAEQFVKELKVPYCFNLQFMKNASDEFVITDVNLRLAGGMSLSAAAGWDEVSALAKIMLDKSEDEIFETLPEKIQPQFVVRAYTDIVTKIGKPVVAFDFDGTLIDSRKRHKIVLDDILKEFDIELDTSDLIDFKRNNKNNVDYLISKGFEEDLARKIQIRWIEDIEKEEYLKQDVLYSDTIEILEKYSKNYDLVLVTARKNKEGLLNQVKSLDIGKFFDSIRIVSPENAMCEKAIILREVNAILFMGDTLSDAQAAKSALVEFKHCDKGFHSERYVKRSLNDTISEMIEDCKRCREIDIKALIDKTKRS